MPENIESETIDWERLYETERFQIPSRKLSECVNRRFRWEGWSPAHKMPVAWLANYAKEFHFTDAEILAARTTSEMPTASGIYFLFNNDECIYVGQTKCFWERSVQHQRNGMHWISHALLEAPKVHAPSIEAYYIRRFNPRFNTDLPADTTYSYLVDKLGLDAHQAPAD